MVTNNPVLLALEAKESAYRRLLSILEQPSDYKLEELSVLFKHRRFKDNTRSGKILKTHNVELETLKKHFCESIRAAIQEIQEEKKLY